MNDLAHELVRLCHRNRDGARMTQANRQRGLIAIANDIYKLGYKLPKAQSIKPKHVYKLLDHWRSAGISTGTIKNRLGWIRWWTQKVNKASILPRTNAELGLPNRKRGQTNKAYALPACIKLKHPNMAMALKLMASFGLRFEEALKLKPSQADHGTVLRLQGSWTKGGRARDIPIRTTEQRELLNQAKQLVPTDALIPTNTSYKAFRKAMEAALIKANVRNVHGLRHQYAQIRYQELTGWPCPLAHGPSSNELSPDQQRLDHQARAVIACELGHGRIAITKTYLG